MRAKGAILALISVALMAGGVALVAYFFLGPGLESTATNSNNPQGFNVPILETTQQARSQDVEAPEDKTLKLTIPGMARVEDASVPDASGDDEDALKNHAAIHLKGTDFPWQTEANVYLAGHRLGYPGYPSFLAFYDLDNLEEGDEVYVEDTDGNEYTYKVFKVFVAEPTDLSVTEPVAGKNILTLQTCTLPDYSQRLIVQAELTDE
jgi:sortase A